MVGAAGETVLDELPNTLPMELSRVKAVVEPDTVQDRVVDCPWVIALGVAIKLPITGAAGKGKARVVKVKSGLDVLLFKASIEVTLKWYRVEGSRPVKVTLWDMAMGLESSRGEDRP